MNRTLHHLAYCNIKKYKRHYLIVSVLVFFIAIFFMSYSICRDNYYLASKKYSQETYGTWYSYAIIEEGYESGALDEYIQQFESVRYGYYFEQGTDDLGYNIAHVTDDLYELCKLTLVKGSYPSNDQEIMISTEMAENLGYELDQDITITKDGMNMGSYQIVGIINKSQEEFPDIYTYSFSSDDICRVYADRNLSIDETMTFHDQVIKSSATYFNSYGFSSGVEEDITQDMQQVIILIEVIGLSAFALLSLTSTSLQRRSQEFALLRGIGMTTKQLFSMVVYEMVYTVFIATILGLICSLGISYEVMKYFATKIGYFSCEYHVLKIIAYSLLLFGCIIISSMYPIYSSSKRSLSGTFDHQNFQYIQVRYKRLKYQNKWRLALRELYVYKKMTISLFMILSVLVVYLTCGFMDPNAKDGFLVPNKKEFSSFHYLEYYPETDEMLYLQDKIPQTYVYRYSVLENNAIWNNQECSLTDTTFYALDDMELLEQCVIEGRIPQNSHEVLMSGYMSIEVETEKNEYSQIAALSINDTFIINGNEYQIVGCIMPNQSQEIRGYFVDLYYLPTNGIYMLPEAHDELFGENDYCMRSYYDTNEEKTFIENSLEGQLSNEYIYCSDDNLLGYDSIGLAVFSSIDPKILIIPAIICLIFSYFLNKNQILNNYNDYALYRLIGMTKKDLMKKQFCKAVLMSLFVLIVQIFWVIMIDIYYSVFKIPYLYVFLTWIVLILIGIVIYCLPISQLLKEDVILSFHENDYMVYKNKSSYQKKHILYQLAFRNIKKYKKHYLFVSFIILCISIFFMSYSIVSDNYYQVKRMSNQDIYGEWYFMATVPEDLVEQLEEYISEFETPVQYGYLFEQGLDQSGYQIAHVSDSIYDLCHLLLESGRYPEKDNEIMVSTSMAENENIQLNQKIILSIKGVNIHEFTVVGFIKNSEPINDHSEKVYFPDIYTHLERGNNRLVIADREMGVEQYGYYNSVLDYSFQDAVINGYGYTQSGMAQYMISGEQVIVFIEILILTVFALNLITSTSLKRRSKEFALLRGIGMTTRQLFLMVLYEIMITTFVMIILGILCSFGVSYLIMLYFQSQLGYFLCEYHIPQIIGYSLLLFACIILAFLYPVASSAKRSLTGAFEGTTFQYIQVRYRRLKLQKKWRLALRELKVYKKMSISLIILCSVIIVSYTFNFMNIYADTARQNQVDEHQNFEEFHYLELYYNEEEEKSKIKAIKDLQLPQTTFIKENPFVEQDMMWNDQLIIPGFSVCILDDLSVLDNCVIEGRIPQKEKEVLINEEALYEGIALTSYNGIQLNDTIKILGEDYQVVGIIKPNEEVKTNDWTYHLYYLPTIGIYVLPNNYFKWTSPDDIFYYSIRIYYEDEDEMLRYTNLIKDAIGDDEWIVSSDDIIYHSEYPGVTFDGISDYVFIVPIIICFIFCFFLNKNHIMNNYSDYALYRLIGMSKKDLMIKELWKAIFVSMIAIVVEMFWIIMINMSNRIWVFPIGHILISFFVIFGILVIIYCIPIYSFLKGDEMSVLYGNE